jgi:endonuclease/exonuclease/phosphatase family metal-dependent hydrolase
MNKTQTFIDSMYTFIEYLRIFIGSSFIYLLSKLPVPPVMITPNKIRKVYFTPDKDDVSIMSYNIHNGRNQLYQNSIDKIIEDIEGNRKSILCLQEVSKELYVHIKDSHGYKYGYHEDDKCILSDHVLLDTDIYYFNNVGIYKTTSFLISGIKIGEEELYVLNTQLSYDIALYNQFYELEELQQYISKKDLGDKKLIVIGDFNCADINLKNYQLNITDILKLDKIKLDNTYPSVLPLVPIDKCFTTNIDVKNSNVVTTTNSTHFPICIEL